MKSLVHSQALDDLQSVHLHSQMMLTRTITVTLRRYISVLLTRVICKTYHNRHLESPFVASSSTMSVTYTPNLAVEQGSSSPNLSSNLLSPVTPFKSMRSQTNPTILITSPRSPTSIKSPRRSRTINALHNKLEYERQIQDQLLLEQQREIETLQSDLEREGQNSSQLNSSLNQTTNELQSAQRTIKDISDKYAVCKRSNDEIKARILSLESSHSSKITELQRMNEDSMSRANALQTKYENAQSVFHQTDSQKDEMISTLNLKISALQQSVTMNSRESTKLIETNTSLDMANQKMKAQIETLNHQMTSVHEECTKLKDTLSKSEENLAVSNEKLTIYEDQVTTYDTLLKDKCKEIESLELRISSLSEQHTSELRILRESMETKQATAAQEVFELQSKYFSAKETITEYQEMERAYKALKQQFNELRTKEQEQEFEVNKRIGKIRRLTEEQGNQESLIRRVRAENSSLSDSLSHYKSKTEQLTKEMAYLKGHSDRVHVMEQQVRDLQADNDRVRNNLTLLLSQPPKVSCSLSRFCENPRCNKPQFAWLSVPLDELNRLRKTVDIGGYDAIPHFAGRRSLASLYSDLPHYADTPCTQPSATRNRLKSYGVGKCERSEKRQRAEPHKIDININNHKGHNSPSTSMSSTERGGSHRHHADCSNDSKDRKYCNCRRRDRLQQLRDLVQDRRTMRRPYY